MAPNAIEFDNSDLTEEEQFQFALHEVKKIIEA